MATPVLHYLDIGSLGRGEVIRLFLKDAGIEFKDVRYKLDDSWPKASAELKAKGISVTGKVPALEFNGLILTQHLPILRFLSRELNSYDGKSNDEKYAVDCVADIYSDWRTAWVTQLSKKTDVYQNETAPEYYQLLAKFYEQRGGPFLLGDQITYVDFAVFQSVDNDLKIGTLPSSLPVAITQLVEAFKARTNIATYLKERE